jgi:hypothetical protein
MINNLILLLCLFSYDPLFIIIYTLLNNTTLLYSNPSPWAGIRVRVLELDKKLDRKEDR